MHRKLFFNKSTIISFCNLSLIIMFFMTCCSVEAAGALKGHKSSPALLSGDKVDELPLSSAQKVLLKKSQNSQNVDKMHNLIQKTNKGFESVKGSTSVLTNDEVIIVRDSSLDKVIMFNGDTITAVEPKVEFDHWIHDQIPTKQSGKGQSERAYKGIPDVIGNASTRIDRAIRRALETRKRAKEAPSAAPKPETPGASAAKSGGKAAPGPKEPTAGNEAAATQPTEAGSATKQLTQQ